MLPFPQLLEYGNTINYNFLGNYEAHTYSAMSVRAEMGYCSTSTGEIYALGGVNGTTFYRDFWKYDPVLDTWSTLLQHPSGARSSPAMAHDPINNTIYVFGGSTGTPSLSTQRNDMYRYNISTNTWSSAITQGGTIPLARIGGKMQYLNGKLYLFGGYYTDASSKTISVYDIASNTWTSLTACPYSMSYSTSTVMIGTDLLCFCVSGGSGVTGAGGTYYLMRYDTVQNTWSTLISTTTQIGRMEYFNGALAMLGMDNGNLYRSDLSNILYLSTIPSYAIDSNIFSNVNNNFILTLGGKSPTTTAAYKLT